MKIRYAIKIENNLTNNCVRIQLILCFLIALFTMMGNSQIVSILFSSTFIVLAINLIVLFRKAKLERRDYHTVVIMFIIIVVAFLSVIIVAHDVSFNYFKKYIMFSSTIIFLFIVSRAIVTTALIDFMLKMNIILCVAYYMFFLLGDAPYYGGGLTLNYTNPNLLALWLLHGILFLIISIFYFKSKVLKLLSIGAVIIVLFMVIETKTRSVLLSLVIFTIMLVFIVFSRRFKFGNFFTAVLILYPIIFAVIYMNAINNPNLIESLDFMTSPGKGLDSRVRIWTDSFAVTKNNLLFGNYYSISDGTGMSQLHNTHIDVLASYGYLVFSGFLIYLYSIALRIANNCESRLQKIALASFFAVIIAGSGEAAFVSGSVGMYILSCSYLLIARYKDTIDSKSI